jgi:hypothetical protein
MPTRRLPTETPDGHDGTEAPGSLVALATDGPLVAGGLNAGRVALGVTALAAPNLAGLLVHRQDRRPVLRMFTRLVGVRDLALGVATIDALRHPGSSQLRKLLWLGVVCDLSDAWATIRQRDIPRTARYLTTAVALAGAAAGTVAAVQVRSASEDGDGDGGQASGRSLAGIPSLSA